MLTTPMTRRETVYGWLYLFFQLLILPVLLRSGNDLLPTPFREAELNFLFFLCNFLAVVLIFHRFLGKALGKVKQHPMYFCQAVVLGLAAYWALSLIFSWLITWFRPGFLNLNDAGISSMARSSRFLMAIGTVLLVPPVEECFFRGLIFKKLWSYSPVAAYLVSILAFAAVHIVGFVGQYSLVDLLLCFLQYLPAGLCLAWSYKKADTIFAPIVIHALVNLRGISLM